MSVTTTQAPFEARKDETGWYVQDLTLDILVGYYAGKEEAQDEAQTLTDLAAPARRVFEARENRHGWFVKDLWTGEMTNEGYFSDQEDAGHAAAELNDKYGDDVATAPAILTATRQHLQQLGLGFTAEQGSGGVWVLLADDLRGPSGTWVFSDDRTLSFYPGGGWFQLDDPARTVQITANTVADVAAEIAEVAR